MAQFSHLKFISFHKSLRMWNGRKCFIPVSYTHLDVYKRQVVIGPRGVANGIVEVKNRKTQEKTEMKIEDFIASLS